MTNDPYEPPISNLEPEEPMVFIERTLKDVVASGVVIILLLFGTLASVEFSGAKVLPLSYLVGLFSTMAFIYIVWLNRAVNIKEAVLLCLSCAFTGVMCMSFSFFLAEIKSWSFLTAVLTLVGATLLYTVISLPVVLIVKWIMNKLFPLEFKSG